jgi:hypothetical protein
METPSVIGTTNKQGQVYTDPAVMMNEAPRHHGLYTGGEVMKEPVRLASRRLIIA